MIFYLSAFMKQKRDPRLSAELDLLMDHNEERRVTDPETWARYQTEVVEVIRGQLGMGTPFRADEVHLKALYEVVVELGFCNR